MPPEPPPIVRLSTGLLFGAAGLVLVDAIVDLVVVNTDLSVYKDAYTGDTGSGFASLVGATVGILVAAGVSILAILNRHGSEKARITTLVLGGLFTVCTGFFGSLSGGFHPPSSSLDGGRVERALPAGYGVLVTVLDLLTVLAVLGGLVLLVLPPATRYFHGRKPVGYVTVPLYHTTTGHPVVQHPTTPPPFPQPPAHSSPFPAQPSPPPEPHSASLPMADPWAEPETEPEYRPRHDGDGPA